MGWLGIPKLIQNVFQSKTDVFKKEVIIPHRMKLDLSLNTDVFARGEEFKYTWLMLAEYPCFFSCFSVSFSQRHSVRNDHFLSKDLCPALKYILD